MTKDLAVRINSAKWERGYVEIVGEPQPWTQMDEEYGYPEVRLETASVYGWAPYSIVVSLKIGGIRYYYLVAPAY